MSQLKQLVKGLRDDYKISERKACGVIMVARSTIHYEARKREDRAIRNRIKEIAEARVLYGFWRIHVLLRREGWQDNHKRTFRIYREEGLICVVKDPEEIKLLLIVWNVQILMVYTSAVRWTL